MNLKQLKELGFTDGEIKVYGALIKLQKSTITKIIEHSGVSSSKVYLILDKLVHRGLVNYIMVDNGMRTNVVGVFAAGDATNHFGSFKQDITAASMGAVAATSAYEYFKSHN